MIRFLFGLGVASFVWGGGLLAEEPSKEAEGSEKASRQTATKSERSPDGAVPEKGESSDKAAPPKKTGADGSGAAAQKPKVRELERPDEASKLVDKTAAKNVPKATDALKQVVPEKAAEGSESGASRKAAATTKATTGLVNDRVTNDVKEGNGSKTEGIVDFVGPQLKKPLALSDRDKKIKRLLAINMRKTKYRKILRKFYKSRNHQLVFHSGDAPDARARYFVDELADLDSHGISSRIFWVFGPKARKQGILWSKRTSPWFEPELEVPTKLSDLVLQDLLLTDALFAYIKRFKFNRSKNGMYNLSVYTLDSKYSEEMMAIARDILVDVKKGLRALWPNSSKYNDLRKHLKTYQALTKEKVPPKLSWYRWKRVKKGKDPSKLLVKNLQTRLQYAGVYEGEVNGDFDESTKASLKSFQQQHNLEAREQLDWVNVGMLNLTHQGRVNKIKASLQRQRDSQLIRDNPQTYIRVNLPAFELTYFEDMKMLRRHKVIIGNRKLDYDRKKWIQGFLNHTPTLKSYVEKVIVNPSWVPTPRILDAEFGGRKGVVVGPSKKNPLGRVKFVLYRTNSIYIHDTNAPGLFKYNARMFSHGCVRLQHATDFSRFLLKKYFDVTSEQYDLVENSDKTKEYALPETLPVYFEYMTADIDAEKGLVFYRDSYLYDRGYRLGYGNVTQRRFGDKRLKPEKVPLISQADYKMLKRKRKPAPMEWPPPEVAPAATEGAVVPSGDAE